jgi:hypothetical protein
MGNFLLLDRANANLHFLFSIVQPITCYVCIALSQWRMQAAPVRPAAAGTRVVRTAVSAFQMVARAFIILFLLQLWPLHVLGQRPVCPLERSQGQQQQQIQPASRTILIDVSSACLLQFSPTAATAAAAGNSSTQQQLVLQGAQSSSLGRPVAVELATAADANATGVVALEPGAFSEGGSHLAHTSTALLGACMCAVHVPEAQAPYYYYA